MDDIKDMQSVFQNSSHFKAILMMAVPTVISQLIAIVYNFADTIFIGLLDDPAQSAAIALALPLTHMITATGNFWGIGGGSAISRALGKEDSQEAKHAAAFSFYGAIISIGLCSVIAFGMESRFTYMLGASEADFIYADKYMFWMFIIGSMPAVLSQALAHFARSLGFAKTASIGLTLGGVLNIMLDPILIFSFGANLGVEGAAIATMLSNVISLVYFIILFYRHRGQWSVSFHIKEALSAKNVAIPVVSVGLPSALIPLLSAVSNGVLNNLVSKHGEVVMAAVGIAKKMDALPASVAVGITQGALPLLAYSYGAREKNRTRRLLYTTGAIAFICTAIIVIFLGIFALPIAGLFIRDAETVWYTTQFIRRLCLSVPLYATTITINSFFQAVNRPRYAFVISIIRKGIFDLPLMVLFDSRFAVMSIIWVQPIMDLVTAVISLLVLKYYLYKHTYENEAP